MFRSLIFSAKLRFNKIQRNRSFSSVILKPIEGFATAEGTKKFIRESDISFHHRFQCSELFINPIIHGPPNPADQLTDTDVTKVFAESLLNSRTNCLYVYNHYDNKPWHTTTLNDILGDYDTCGLTRDQVVVVAGLGVISDIETIEKRIDEATSLSGIQSIDIGIIELTTEILMTQSLTHLNSCFSKLENLVHSNKLQSYGIKLNVPPYNYHTPPLSTTGETALWPNLVEGLFYDQEFGELMVYNITPSHAIPASLPMLTSEETMESEDEIVYEEERAFSRVSCDPFTCLTGLGDLNTSVQESHGEEVVSNALMKLKVLESKLNIKGYAQECIHRGGYIDSEVFISKDTLTPEADASISGALDSLCPLLKSTKRVEDKVLRIVLSMGIDAVIVDAAMSAFIGKLRLKPEDLLDSNDTEQIFGSFCIPKLSQLNK